MRPSDEFRVTCAHIYIAREPPKDIKKNTPLKRQCRNARSNLPLVAVQGRCGSSAKKICMQLGEFRTRKAALHWALVSYDGGGGTDVELRHEPSVVGR